MNPRLPMDTPLESTLDDVVDVLATRLSEGESVDINDYVSKYPHLEDPLREAHATLIGMCQFRHSGEKALLHRAPLKFDAPRELGDFRIICEIGRGGMGIVYEAQQISLGRRVALKVLPFAAILDDRRLQRFKNEAQAAAALKHPNIVSVHFVGCERGVHFYAMELIDGITLAELIRRAGRSNSDVIPHERSQDTQPIAGVSTQDDASEVYRRVTRIGEQAAGALHFAHQNGIVHRDVKPSNILIDGQGQVAITDFGLALFTSRESLTATGDLVGTVHYMSPEQLEDDNVVDQRTDVYSLGLTLYELIASRPAYAPEKQYAAVINEILQTDPPPLQSLVRGVPRDLANVIHKAIAKSPSERYGSAADFAADLRRFLDRVPVRARPIGRMQRLARWCLRNRSKAALIGVLLTVLLALAVGGPLVAVQQARIAEAQKRALYGADMIKAHEHALRREIDQAAAILRRYSNSDYRNMEWYFLAGLCKRRLEAFQVKSVVPFFDVEYSPNTSQLAMANYFGLIRVIDAATGDEKWRTFDRETKHSQWIHDLCYTADGERLFSLGWDKKLKIWNASDGRLIHSHTVDRPVTSMAVSPTGLIALGLDPGDHYSSFPNDLPSEIQLASLKPQRLSDGGKPAIEDLGRLSGLVGTVWSVAYSSDGRWLAAGCEDDVLRIWNVETRELVASLDGHQGPILNVSFSSDCQRICASGGHFDREWRAGHAVVWDWPSQTRRFMAQHEDRVNAAKFMPDGRLVTADVGGQVRVWDVDSGVMLDDIPAHSDEVLDVSVAHDGNTIATGGSDNRVRLWTPHKSPQARNRVRDGFVDLLDLSFSPDGKYFVSGSGDGIGRIWDTRIGTLVQRLEKQPEPITGVDYSPDGKVIASITSHIKTDAEIPGELTLWDALTGDVLHRQSLNGIRQSRAVRFSPNGKFLCFLGNGAIHVWKVETHTFEQPIILGDGTELGIWLDFCESVLGCSTMGREGRVRVWKFRTRELIYESADLPAQAFSFAFAISQDGKYAAASDLEGYGVSIRRIPSGEIVHELRGHTDQTMFVDFSPDGERLVSAGKDGSVVLWDLKSGREVLRFRDHDNWVWSARFSPDGRTLISADVGRSMPPSIVIRRSLSERQASSLLAVDK